MGDQMLGENQEELNEQKVNRFYVYQYNCNQDKNYNNSNNNESFRSTYSSRSSVNFIDKNCRQSGINEVKGLIKQQLELLE